MRERYQQEFEGQKRSSFGMTKTVLLLGCSYLPFHGHRVTTSWSGILSFLRFVRGINFGGGLIFLVVNFDAALAYYRVDAG